MHSNEDPANPGTGISPQTIFVRMTSGSDVNGTGGTGCSTLVSFTITVNPLPVIPAATVSLNLLACEADGNETESFDLTQNTATILALQSSANFSVTYHKTLVSAQAGTPRIATPAAYMNTSNPQTIFVNITNNDTTCSISTLSFTLTVNDEATATPFTAPFEMCDDNMEFNNSPLTYSTTFDLVSQNPAVLGTQNATDFIVRYYETQALAEEGIPANALPDMYANTSNPQTIYVRVDNDTMTGTPPMDSSLCYAVTPLTLQVNPMPSFDLDDMYLICANKNNTEVLPDDVIDTGLDIATYSFEWFLNGSTTPIVGATAPTYAPTEGGTYSVVVTNRTTSCANESTDPNAMTIVEVSTPPVITANVSTAAFADSHTIEVTATGDGISVFEFSLDGGAYVENSPNNGMYTFTNVSAGQHIITVRDKNGCGSDTKTVQVMDYPKFFTPNGDGFNDNWNIYSIADQPGATIYIFDRMGKLLKQISPTGSGWDGTYNNNPMPTSDYWFTVEYTEPNSPSTEKKLFKSHFTLKR